MRALIPAALVAHLAGCFGSPVRDDCRVLCGEGGACPDDYRCGADLHCHPADDDAPRDCAAPGGGDGGGAARVPCEDAGECDGDGAECRCGACATPDATCTASSLRYASSTPEGGDCVPGATGVTAGTQHTCAVLSDGAAFCWGGNCNGQLGNPSVTSDGECVTTEARSLLPVPVVHGGALAQVGFGAIDAGLLHTCGILDDGTALCWGDDRDGQLGRGTNGDESDDPQPVIAGRAPLEALTHQASGWFHGCALATDGSAWCWGDNSSGQIGVDDWSGALDLRNSAEEVDLATPMSQIGAGTGHSCAVVEGDRAMCWGRNHFGQLGTADDLDPQPMPEPTPVTVLREPDGLPLEDITTLAVGNHRTCAATVSPQAIWCWGSNLDHALGDDSAPESPDGVDAGRARAVALTPASPVAALESGGHVSCAVLEIGDLWCWGANDQDQIGVASAEPWLPPTLVASDIADVAIGFDHVCAVAQGGRVLCWGDNVHGQLGNGTATDASEPTPTAEMCP